MEYSGETKPGVVLVTNVNGVDNCRLEPGWYVVANRTVEDASDPRVRRAHTLLPENDVRLLDQLQKLCRDHGTPGAKEDDAVCVHRELAETRSSSLLMVTDDGGVEYWHAKGAPCGTIYNRVMIPWDVNERR